MPLRTAERTSLWITCDGCQQATEKPVAWLALQDSFTCGNCGASVDLQSAKNRLLIKETDDNCARIDVALAKLGKTA